MATHLIAFAWAWFVAGLASGVVLGLGFWRNDYLGGYDAWPRRLTRLGHIAFFGTGLLCLAMGLTAHVLRLEPAALRWAGALTIAGAVAMPAVCFLSAWRKPWRHAFALPVLGLVGGCGLFLFHLYREILP